MHWWVFHSFPKVTAFLTAYMGVEVHDKKIESSLLGGSQV